MIKHNGLLILGFGGHARSIADVALAIGFQSLLFIDENARENEQFLNFPVQRELNGELLEGWYCMPASGNNRKREQQIQLAQLAGWPLATLISPYATVGFGAVVSQGCFVGHHAHIGPMTQVGTGCIINTGAIIDHECVIGDYVSVSPNVSVAGRSKLGDYVFLGAGVTVIENIMIGNNITVGAGGVVISSLNNPGTYVGVPVRIIKHLDLSKTMPMDC